MKKYKHSGINGVPMAFMCDERVRPVNGVLQRDDDYYANEYACTREDNYIEFDLEISNLHEGQNNISINAGGIQIDLSVTLS